MTITRSGPASGEALRAALYEGSIVLAPATAGSLRLVELTRAALERLFESEDPRTRAAELDDEDVFARVGAVRRELFTAPEVHAVLRELVGELGLDAREVAIDPPRLRAILPGGARNPRAKAVYYAHRDTWYGHPAQLITWWVPLDDLPEEETFVFYPELLAREVPNDSERFDYDAWTARGLALRIGWQDREAGVREQYPAVNVELPEDARAVGFSCARGENLLFSGAHLHRTLPQEGRRARFSVDFRVVHLGDHERGRGAPSVDDRSRGSALSDYLWPAAR